MDRSNKWRDDEELPMSLEGLGNSRYFVFFKTKKWEVYKDKGWWYIYEWLDLDYAEYKGMGKTRAKLIKEFVK